MSRIVIDGKIINLDKIHFVRRESDTELLVSFGTDFLRFRGSPNKVEEIFNKLEYGNNEELSGNHRR